MTIQNHNFHGAPANIALNDIRIIVEELFCLPQGFLLQHSGQFNELFKREIGNAAPIQHREWDTQSEQAINRETRLP